MKTVLFLIINLCLLLPSSLSAQDEGVITYEVMTDNHRNLAADRQDMKAMIPQYLTLKQQLFFNANESLYKPLIEDEDEDTQGGGGRRFMFRRRGTTNYFNQSTSLFFSVVDLMGKKYLITDTLKMAPWKFGAEVKVIQGYNCMQAYYTTSNEEHPRTITAWFTNKLRPMLGPEKYNSLPGAVLAIDINNGEQVFVAKKIELRPLKKNEIQIPEEGEKISQAEFKKKGDEVRQRFNNRGGRFRN